MTRRLLVRAARKTGASARAERSSISTKAARGRNDSSSSRRSREESWFAPPSGGMARGDNERGGKFIDSPPDGASMLRARRRAAAQKDRADFASEGAAKIRARKNHADDFAERRFRHAGRTGPFARRISRADRTPDSRGRAGRAVARLVCARVCGMIQTAKLSCETSATVRLIPFTAIEPFAGSSAQTRRAARPRSAGRRLVLPTPGWAGAIHVSLDKMAPETSIGRQRALEIDRGASQRFQICPVESLQEKIECQFSSRREATVRQQPFTATLSPICDFAASRGAAICSCLSAPWLEGQRPGQFPRSGP